MTGFLEPLFHNLAVYRVVFGDEDAEVIGLGGFGLFGGFVRNVEENSRGTFWLRTREIAALTWFLCDTKWFDRGFGVGHVGLTAGLRGRRVDEFC